ncbi:MAG TPA: hypothetical protein VG148_14770 [Pyrinomonadaceae bacterium]|nr:hypothetical protein [Pyrinomonadaceae bacterium]
MSQSRRDVNPFPGLRPFETEEYLLFFGREGQSDELLARLGRARLLAVVGTSGSGKSSLVRAGLLPALRGGLMKGAGSAWRIAVMRPGHDPVGNLACALAARGVLAEAGGGLRGAEAEALVEATLRGSSLGLVAAARQARLGEHENLLVVVDQFEELFRFRAARAGTGDDAAAFVKLLLEAARQRELPIYVVITMRSDFLGDCAQFQGLPEAINDGQYLIPRMTRDERRVAITGPVAVSRGRVAEPLVSRLLNDVGDNPDQLPILQHALMRTWDYWKQHRRDSEPLGVEHYEAIGTMEGALSRHADEAWDELPDERSRQIAEKMFRALTEKGADSRETRRPTRLRQIAEIAGASGAEVASVVEVFRRAGRSFLMPPPGVELTGDVVIDISHESLIRNWQRLKDWAADEAQSARIYRRVAEAAVLHRDGLEGLMQDPALQLALEWRERSRPNAAWGRRYHPEFELAVAYLEASREARDAAAAERERQRREEIERERREREQAQQFAAEQARSARRMRRLTYAMILLALLSAGTAAFALYARAEAKRSQGAAEESARVASEAKGKAERSLAGERRALADLAEQTRAARASAEEATAANERAQVALKRAEAEATRANKQAAIAAENFRKAEAARQQAVENERQVIAAAERGELLRKGIEDYRREEYDDALEKFQQLRAQLEALQPNPSAPPDTPPRRYAEDLGWTLTNIGAALQKKSSYDDAVRRKQYEEAIMHYEKARAILEQTLPPDSNDPILLDTYHGLADSYHFVGRGYLLDGPSRPLRADAQRAAGGGRALEAFAKAEENFRRALSFQLKHRKEKPSEAAAGHLNLARLYADSGKPAEAEENFKRAVELRRLGKPSAELNEAERAALVAALKDLAEFYQAQADRHDDAARTFGEMIVVQEDITVGELVGQGQAIAVSYSDLGQMHEARRAALLAAAQSAPGEKERKAAEEEASRYARAAENAFSAANLLQRTALKLRQMEKGAASLANASGLVKGLTADLDELGDAYVRLGKLPDAEALYTTALGYRQGTPEQFASYYKLARFYLEHMKDYAKAEEFKQHLNAAFQEDIYRGDSALAAQYAAALVQLAATYAKEPDKLADAESAYQRALDIYATQEDWMNENAVLYSLDELYRKQRKTAEREQVVRRRLETLTKYFRRLTGLNAGRPKSPILLVTEYLNAVERAGIILARNKKTAEAEAAYRGAFEASDLITGSYSSLKVLTSYASTLERYQALLDEQGKKPEAERVAAKAMAVRDKERQFGRFEELRNQENAQKSSYGPSQSSQPAPATAPQ